MALLSNSLATGSWSSEASTSASAAALPYYTNALLYPADWRWNADAPHGSAVTVSYSFMTRNPGSYGGFQPFSEAEKTAARDALAEWSKVCNITFKEVASGGQIAFGDADVGGASGITLWNGTTGANSGLKITHADIYMSSTQSLSYADGGFGYRALLHEIGHSLGLKHSFDNSGTTLSGVENTAQYAVMSYDNPPATPNAQPFTPQLYDIAAAQYLYGANKATNAGDTIYQWSATKAQVMTIWDGGGFDTMDASNQTIGCLLDLRQGKFSSLGVYNGAPAKNTVAIAFGTVIEKAVGGQGGDTIIGNDAANVIVGGAGNDRLTGGGGGDAFCYGAIGQGGDTILDFLSGNDRFEFDADSFGNAVQFATASGGYGGGANASFIFDANGDLWFDANGAAAGGATRMATLSNGTVAASDIHLVGDITAPSPASLSGTSGNDTLSGSGGDVTMSGGLGNDTYIVDSMGDRVVEYASQGVDTVKSGLSYTLSSYLENLSLTGGNAINGTGSSWHNQITGNAAGNTLKGLAGNDSLSGLGGNDVLTGDSGRDVMTGGSGADTFKYLSSGDGSLQSVNTTKGSLKGDTITDFASGVDKLWFDDVSFALALGGAQSGVNFSKIATAYDGSNANAADYSAGKGTLIFDSTGTLYFDANGKAAGYHILATIQAGATVTAADIIIA